MKKGQHSTYEWVIWEAPNGDWKQADTIDYLDTERSGYEHAMRYLSDSREADIQAIEFRKTIWQSEEKGGGAIFMEYAYIEDGKLPEVFDAGAQIPKRFQKEVANYHEKNPTAPKATAFELLKFLANG